MSVQSVERKPKESDSQAEADKLSSLTEKLQGFRVNRKNNNKQLKRKVERKDKQKELSKAKRAKIRVKYLLSKWRSNLFHKLKSKVRF